MTAQQTRRVRARWYANVMLTAGVTLALTVAGPSQAQPQEAANAKPAVCRGKDPVKLFKQGYELWTNKEPAKACQLFLTSYRCGRSSGNTFNWARCNEQTLGNPAAGYNLYVEAAEQAAALNQTIREKAAREAAEGLKARVTLVTVHLPQGKLPYARKDLKVTLNNQPIATTEFGKVRAIGSGSCRIEAAAPGFKTWRYTELAVPGRTLDINVPRLPAEPVPQPPVVPTTTIPLPTATASSTTAPPRPPDDSAMSGTRLAGFITGGAGIALLIVGSVLGGLAVADEGAANDLCDGQLCNLDEEEGNEGWDKIQAAKAESTGATVTLVLGAAAVGTGLVLLLYSGWPGAEKEDTTAVRVAPHVSEHGGGLVVIGRF
jgi:hypothetical protein